MRTQKTSLVGAALSALSGSPLPLHVHTARLLKRAWFLTYPRKPQAEPDLDDAELCEKMFASDRFPNGDRPEHVRRFPGDKHSATMLEERTRKQPQRDFEGKIIRDAEGNHLEESIKQMVKVPERMSWYGGLLRAVAARLGLEAKSMHQYNVSELTLIFLDVAKQVRALDGRDSDDSAARRMSHPHYPAGWEVSLDQADELAKQVAKAAKRD